MLTDNCAFNSQLAVKPIHITPLQSQALTDSEAETYTEQSHRAEWFLKMLNELSELIHRQAARLPRALGRPFDHHKVNGITRNLQHTTPHGKFHEQMQHASHMGFALGRQVPIPATIVLPVVVEL